MTMLAKQTNGLQQFVLENGLDKRSMKWTSIDADSNTITDFPRLTEGDIRNLTIGVYQLKTAKSYAAEHLTDDGLFEIFVSDDIPNIVSAKIQSRHTSSKKYSLWIKYDITILFWYCTCKNGSRVVGMCGHISCIIWYLAFARYQNESCGIRDWTEEVDDAARSIASSEDEDTVDYDGQEE
ncbi:uncharacterized protein LOC125673525 [Ostrea edulis]|nr:uncharacterized protein LOC125673525 [Ostrea edulis]